MTMAERHLADSLDVPNEVNDFIGGAEKRAKKHSKKGFDGLTTVTSMRLRKKTHKRLKMASAELDQKIGDIVDAAVNEYLDRQPKKTKAFDEEEDGL